MSNPPKAPQGHEGPIEYTTNNTVLSLLQLALLLTTLRVWFPGLVLAFLSSMPFDEGDVVEYLAQHTQMATVLVFFIPAMVLVHELVHFAAGRWCGHDPKFGFKIHLQFGFIPELMPYVVTLDQFIEQRENIIVLGAPLVCLNTLALLGWLIPVMPPIIDFLSRVVLVTNTSFSVMDIYNVAKVASVRRGTLFRNYNSNDDEVDTAMYPPRS